jgi:hypothetical protein
MCIDKWVTAVGEHNHAKDAWVYLLKLNPNQEVIMATQEIDISTETMPDKDAVANELVMAVQEVRKAEGDKTSAYAQIVLKCGKCEDAGFNRSQIAKMIAKAWGSEKESKGLAARYVILSRLQKKQFAKNELPVESITVKETQHKMDGDNVVEVHVETTYATPVDMLMSGKHTFTGVYNAWKAATTPVKPELEGLPDTIVEAAERIMGRMKIVSKDFPSGVKPTENIAAWKAVMLVMLGQPVAQTVFGKNGVKLMAKKVGHVLVDDGEDENPKVESGEVKAA